MSEPNTAFDGEIPRNYDRHLGPILLEPYAAEMIERLPSTPCEDLLELACGTGILTRRLHDRLPPRTRIVATDLSPSMLAVAEENLGVSDRLSFRQADAISLPFLDESFDAIVCQFGFMFVPDKALAFSEAFRVLRPGGSLLFDVWESLSKNDPARLAEALLIESFPNDPPPFLRVPYSYDDPSLILADLDRAGFVDAGLVPVAKSLDGHSASSLALGMIYGTPMKNVLSERGVSLEEFTETLTSRLVNSLGKTLSEAGVSAFIVSATKG